MFIIYIYMADIAIKKAAVMTALGNLKEYPLTGGKSSFNSCNRIY